MNSFVLLTILTAITLSSNYCQTSAAQNWYVNRQPYGGGQQTQSQTQPQQTYLPRPYIPSIPPAVPYNPAASVVQQPYYPPPRTSQVASSTNEQGNFPIVIQCDKKLPCPGGMTCAPNRDIPGTQTCESGYRNTRKRPGNCPKSFAFISSTTGQNTCTYDEDCRGANQKCCPQGNLRSCMQSIPAPQRTPVLTTLLPGTLNMARDGLANTVSSVVLVQSQGKNILFETAGVSEKGLLLQALRNQGLFPDDIDYVITSHGHPDHYGNINLFPNVKQNFDRFEITGDKFTFNAIQKKQRYFPTGDMNVELIEAPGHTPQDTTLIVRNVRGKGSVYLTGDLFLDQNDYKSNPENRSFDPTVAKQSRNTVACNADWIIPGHGPEFRVTPQYRSNFQCR